MFPIYLVVAQHQCRKVPVVFGGGHQDGDSELGVDEEVRWWGDGEVAAKGKKGDFLLLGEIFLYSSYAELQINELCAICGRV
jgi:precorrin-2 methylase